MLKNPEKLNKQLGDMLKMEEKLNDKTCGECSWFSDNRCNLHNNQYIFGDRSACKDFKTANAPAESEGEGE